MATQIAPMAATSSETETGQRLQATMELICWSANQAMAPAYSPAHLPKRTDLNGVRPALLMSQPFRGKVDDQVDRYPGDHHEIPVDGILRDVDEAPALAMLRHHQGGQH